MSIDTVSETLPQMLGEEFKLSPYAQARVNHLTPEHTGCAISLNPWMANVSSSRLYMFAGHLGQMLVISNPTIRRCLTGTEREYGKYVFNTKFEDTSRIIRVINKFGSGRGDINAITHNPSQVIIYEHAYTGVIDILENNEFVKKHQTFGYFLKPTENIRMLEPGAVITPEYGIIAQSPNVTKDGDWTYGIELETAFMSIPQVIEDGVVAARSALERMSYDVINSVVASCGGIFIPLNLYGDETHYKPFPDAGECVKEHGIVIALRRYDPNLAFVELTPRALMEVDYGFDRLFYGEPGAKVVDVDVYWGGEQRLVQDRLPVGTTSQLEKYHNKAMDFYHTVISTYDTLVRERRQNLVISPAFQRLMREAYARTKDGGKKIFYRWKHQPLDDWRIKVTYHHRAVPTVGNKITGCSGDKGIIVDIWDDADMPVDFFGRRADLIMDGDSTIKRMNPGRLYEQYINAASWHVATRARAIVGTEGVRRAFDYILGYYATVSPEFAEATLRYLKTQADPNEAMAYHVQKVLEDGVYLWIPASSKVVGAEQIRRLKASKYRPPKTPVKYRGRSGKIRTTKSDILIGSLYIILLEKTGDDWSSVASPKLQHFGIPAKQSRLDKLSTPGKKTPVRFLGEDEVRLVGANCGGWVVAELLDQTNSPLAHKFIARNLLTAEKPSRIARIIDRNIIPLGLNRATTFVKHILQCGGIRIVTGGPDVRY